MIDDLWTLEADLWTGGVDSFAAAVAPDTAMVFPQPTGILSGERLIASLEGVPRWSEVDMSERRSIEIGPGAWLLIYRAEARREGQGTYSALCSSVYRRNGAGARIVHHQQTPV